MAIEYETMPIVGELPPAGHYTDRATQLFARLAGARIVACGTPADSTAVEGGGFVIDFIEPESNQIRRVVFGFTELGMWVEFDGLRGRQNLR